ncbi:MAG: RCC1 domain-containing protein, partial [Gemmatimonadota bacterium]
LVEVIVGPMMVCGFTQERQLYCLGEPTIPLLPYTQTLIPVFPELEVTSVALGNTQVCVLTAQGEAYCWGSNLYGQLGSGGSSLGWDHPVGVWEPSGN